MSAGALPAISSPRLATFIICQICVCARPLCVCACVRALRPCTWLEKPEPLLESGHDLAVTHGDGEAGWRRRRRMKGGRARRRQQQQHGLLKNKRKLRVTSERASERASARRADPPRSFQRAHYRARRAHGRARGAPPLLLLLPKLSSPTAYSKYKDEEG